LLMLHNFQKNIFIFLVIFSFFYWQAKDNMIYLRCKEAKRKTVGYWWYFMSNLDFSLCTIMLRTGGHANAQ
jgi:hypothetical protein